MVSADEASATTLGIGDSRIAVHCDLGSGTSGKDICLSQSGRDGVLHVAELNGVVSADKASATTLGIGDSRILIHCDLGSGTSGNNSLTVTTRQDFACGGIE